MARNNQQAGGRRAARAPEDLGRRSLRRGSHDKVE